MMKAQLSCKQSCVSLVKSKTTHRKSVLCSFVKSKITHRKGFFGGKPYFTFILRFFLKQSPGLQKI